MNQILFWLVMRGGGLWERMGADLVQLKALLKVRLMLDDRKPMTIGRQRKESKVKFGSLFSALAFLFMGFVYIMPLISVPDRIYSLTLYFSFVLGILVFILLTDFSSVLFDARDKYIIYPRPVDDQTLVLARILHIFIYIARIALPLSLPGWVTLGILEGWRSVLLFPVALLLTVSTAIFLVNGIYLLVLRSIRPERFKDVINYFQIAASIVFVGGFYILPRLFDSDHPMVYNILYKPWLRFLPSYWIACCWSWLGYPSAFPGAIWYGDLAVFLPALFVILVVKVLAPQFVQRLAGIDAVDVAPTVRTVKKGGRRGSFAHSMARLFSKDGDERAGFTIAWLMSARSRSFRMRVYPSFGMAIMYFLFLFSRSDMSFSEMMTHASHKPFHLFILYYSSFVIMNAMNYMVMSDQYKAAWVYYAAPVAMPGRIMAGALKAMWVKFFLPFYLVLSAIILFIWGPSSVWDIALAMINVTLFVAAVARTGLRHLPFSIMEMTKQKGARVVKSLLAMFIPMSLGMAHYLCVAADLLWLKIVFMFLSGGLLWLVWTSYAATSWDKMIKGELES